MKSYILAAFLLLLPHGVLARGGIGIVLGDPTGLTGKLFVSKHEAVDLSLGWSSGRIRLNSSYLWHGRTTLEIDNVPLDYYVGAGLKLREHRKRVGPPPHTEKEELELGFRVPVGLRHLFRHPPIEVFAEVAPALMLTPDTDLDIGLAVGARYFF